MGVIQKLSWAVTFLAACFSVFLLIVMLRNGARGEPALDQIRLAAAAAAIALVPYILSRALQEMLRSAAGVTTQPPSLPLSSLPWASRLPSLSG